MKRVLLFILVLCSIMPLWAENYYVVYFFDKQHSTYSVQRPQEFLSTKALERRSKFHIALDTTDLPISEVYLDSVKNTGAQIRQCSKWLNYCVAIVPSDSILHQIQQLSCVDTTVLCKKITVPSPLRSVLKQPTSIDTMYYNTSFMQNNMLNVPQIHDLGFLGDSIKIAILDAGFTYANTETAFDSLRAYDRLTPIYDFVDMDTTLFHGNIHGTQVLSTMGGQMPRSFVGSAPKAHFYLFRTEDALTEWPIETDNWVSAAEKADSLGIDLITSSLGYYSFDDDSLSYSWTDLDGQTSRVSRAAEMAVQKGIFVVNSAGNEGNKTWHYITVPSDADDVLCVGAVDSQESYAYFSSTGPSADGRIKPDVVALGQEAVVMGQGSTPLLANGTSYSTPITAGMVACLLQAFPNQAPIDLVQIIRETSSQYATPDSLKGYGVPDALAVYNYLQTTTLDSDEPQVAPDLFFSSSDYTIYFNNTCEAHEALVYTMMGQRVIHQKSAESKLTQVSLTNLPQGLYIVQYKAGLVWKNSKVLVP